MTTLPFISHLDFFIRYACIGQLVLLLAYLIYKPCSKQATWAAQTIPLLLASGITAYLLLTAPFYPLPQGFVRSVLLMFTHIMPLLLWLYGKQLFDDEFNLQRWSLWGKTALVLLALFYIVRAHLCCRTFANKPSKKYNHNKLTSREIINESS